MIISWLEHGDPARDAEVLERIPRAAGAAVETPDRRLP
jgi:hypothetical protein